MITSITLFKTKNPEKTYPCSPHVPSPRVANHKKLKVTAWISRSDLVSKEGQAKEDTCKRSHGWFCFGPDRFKMGSWRSFLNANLKTSKCKPNYNYNIPFQRNVCFKYRSEIKLRWWWTCALCHSFPVLTVQLKKKISTEITVNSLIKTNRSLYASIYGSHTDCLTSCRLKTLLSFNFVQFGRLLLFNDSSCMFVHLCWFMQ